MVIHTAQASAYRPRFNFLARSGGLLLLLPASLDPTRPSLAYIDYAPPYSITHLLMPSLMNQGRGGRPVACMEAFSGVPPQSRPGPAFLRAVQGLLNQ